MRLLDCMTLPDVTFSDHFDDYCVTCVVWNFESRSSRVNIFHCLQSPKVALKANQIYSSFLVDH